MRIMMYMCHAGPPLDLLFLALPLTFVWLAPRWPRAGRRGKIVLSLLAAGVLVLAGGLLLLADRALAASDTEVTVTVYRVHTDHLGTPIIMTDKGRQAIYLTPFIHITRLVHARFIIQCRVTF